ncbi:MAG: 50S ribosomal protein L4 [Bacteroidales bacterium]|nr:50S ribosomal protein L4 [Bacteroidales bacterium]
MEIKVLNKNGQETGRVVSLEKEVFAIEPNDHAIYLDVKQYMANNRQGTHKSKERAEIAGSTKKIKRQKGTGTARAGSVKSPVFVGGGRVFGPRPKDYTQKLNKKLKQLARKSALAYKVQNNSIFVMEDYSPEQPKTKEVASIANNLKLNDKKLLFVLSEKSQNFVLSARNLQKIDVVQANSINTYDIMNASALVIMESSVEVLNKL